MLAFPKQTMEGAFTNTSHGLLAPPPLHTMARSKTGRKPQRSSPLAGPAVSVSDGEDASGLLRTSSSPNLNPPESRPIVSSGLTRPKSMYSTLSLHPQSFSPPDRSRQPGNKQPLRPMSAVLSTSTTRIHLSDQNLSRPRSAGDFRSLGEQTGSGYSQFPPFTSEHPLPSTTQLRPPTIMLNEEAIEAPQIPIPPLARSTSRITETTIPRDNSWYVTSAYEETPRFSRLGLAADSVVMPVSAKKFKKVQQSSGNRGLCESTTSMKKPAARQSLLIGSLASTLKLTRSHIRTPSEHQSAQEPSPTSSLSLRTSSTDSDSSPSATSTSSPVSNLSRTRTNSPTDSSSSHTFFTPDVVTSSSRTSINDDEKTIQKSLPTLPLNLETTSIISPAVNKDGKPRRGGTFKRFIRLFILQ